MSSERLLKIEEVALSVGVSVKTINFWYMFKRENPDNEYAKMIPDYVQIGNRGQRFWTQDAIWKLMEFRKQIPNGRGGVMGSTTHKAKSTKENEENGKKKVSSRKNTSTSRTACNGVT